MAFSPTESVPFYRPNRTGAEFAALAKRVDSAASWSANGQCTNELHGRMMELLGGHGQVFFTTSCTAALELSGLLLHIEAGDEVIVPSYTYVTSASAFALRGARIVFADSRSDSPHVSCESIAAATTERTRAVVIVHYGGYSADLASIIEHCRSRGIALIEDSAHAFAVMHSGRALGTFGQVGTFSFHDTKNVSCGEGGALWVPDELAEAAEIIWEKGTDRARFLRGEVSKYEWIALGSSYGGSDILACILLAQLATISDNHRRRRSIWNDYYQAFSACENESLLLPLRPTTEDFSAHIFHLVLGDAETARKFRKELLVAGIETAPHYVPLHTTPCGVRLAASKSPLPNSERYGACLVRLPLYPTLTEAQQQRVIDAVLNFRGQ